MWWRSDNLKMGDPLNYEKAKSNLQQIEDLTGYDQVYESGQWGGALIIDKFNETTGVTEEKNQEKNNRFKQSTRIRSLSI